MRLSAFVAVVVGLALSWISLGFLSWIDLAIGRRPYIRWQDLGLVLGGAKDVSSDFNRGFIAPGLIFVVAALSALTPSLFARTKLARRLMSGTYFALLVLLGVALIADLSDSTPVQDDERGLVVGVIVVFVALVAIPAVLLLLDKAWLLGILVALIALAGAIILGFALYDLFADAIVGPQIGAYAAVVGLLAIAVGGYLATEGGSRVRRAGVDPTSLPSSLPASEPASDHHIP